MCSIARYILLNIGNELAQPSLSTLEHNGAVLLNGWWGSIVPNILRKLL